VLTLAVRFGGRHWSVVASPSPTGDNDFLSVAAVGPGPAPGVWAAGSFAGTQTLALHYCWA
jgi:hypothetical protein